MWARVIATSTRESLPRRVAVVVWSRIPRRCSSTSSTSSTTNVKNRNVPFASSTVALVAASLATGFAVGRLSSPSPPRPQQQLPSGLPRTCCQQDHDDHKSSSSINSYEDRLTLAQRELPHQLAHVVGPSNVLPGTSPTFLKGARLGGGGRALCILTPESLQDVIKCAQMIVDADCVLLPQGRNTGLTGGSVPRATSSPSNISRPVVIVNFQHLDTIFPIDDGDRVVCLAGAGLASLQRFLATHFDHRESHSTLGSTFLNPTTAAGVAFGSGGTQLRKGPAYTDRALYLKIYKNKWKENVIQVVNTLGIEGIEDSDFPNQQSGSVVEQLDIYQRDVREGYGRAMARSSDSEFGRAASSDANYGQRLCVLDQTVSRCNAHTHGADCNRSEGKVLILATVHDTFPRALDTKSFWISFDSLETALAFRRDVCLDNAEDLPMSVEYMDRDSFDVIDRAGRIMGNLIKLVGTASPIVQHLWNIKLWIEALPFRSAPLWIDQLLYTFNPVLPATLPRRMMEAGRAMDHHIAMTVGEFGTGTMDRLLDRLHSFASKHGRDKIVIHECQSQREVASLSAFRFLAAPASRTWCVGRGVQGFSVDYALPKNGGDAPALLSKKHQPIKRMRYSHFGCNVVHEDVAYGPDVDIHEAKMELKRTVEQKCFGKLPAEHGHGIEYHAPPETQARWKRMDPLNVMNPGIGGLSENYQYKED